MFYEPGKQPHGLPHNPFKSLIVPRPIAWITSQNRDGVVNVAPFSHFSICSADLPAVMFSADEKRGTNERKDSHRNAEESGEFVVNIPTYDLREKMNLTSAEVPSSVSEAALAGLTLIPSKIVAPPRIAESPIQLECRHLTSLRLSDVASSPVHDTIVVGQVVGIHIDESVMTDGMLDIQKLQPIARLGYMDYALISSTFTMKRPAAPNSE